MPAAASSAASGSGQSGPDGHEAATAGDAGKRCRPWAANRSSRVAPGRSIRASHSSAPALVSSIQETCWARKYADGMVSRVTVASTTVVHEPELA
jgi:hypothetical protein